MRQKKLAYLRQLLLYTQLERVAPLALWSEEAKQSIRLSADCNILGLETRHCKATEVVISLFRISGITCWVWLILQGLVEAKVNVQRALEKLCSDVVRWSGQDLGTYLIMAGAFSRAAYR